MGGTGWCTHPKRQTSNDVRILVRKAELACRNAWGKDYWEAMDGAVDDDAVARPSSGDVPGTSTPIQVSFEDEVTSVVNADLQRAHDNADRSDRVVEQTNLEPDHPGDDEDRFGLLAHGGRDSVSQARERLRRRRSGNPESDTETTASDTSARETSFPPDDFIEEETPSPESFRHREDRASTHDDVVLNEGLAQSTPRSRRLRRIREKPVHPKTEAVVRTGPDVERPTTNPGQQETGDPGPFDSVPTISSDIDLSRLRRNPAGGDPVPDADARQAPAQATASPDDAFERAIRHAEAVKAAARIERAERQQSRRRPGALLAREPAREPEIADEPSQTYPVDYDTSRNNPHGGDPDPHPITASRSSITTRDLDDHGYPDDFADEFDEALTSEPWRDTRQNEARSSWWRGLFQNRQRQSRQYDEYIDDEEDLSLTASDAEWDEQIDDDAGYDDDATDNIPYYDEEPESENTWLIAQESPLPRPDRTPQHQRAFEPVDLEQEEGMHAFRDRLFAAPEPNLAPIRQQPESRESEPSPVSRTTWRKPLASRTRLDPDDLLEAPEDAWYQPEVRDGFDVRKLIDQSNELLDMTIDIAPEVPRECSTCRSYRKSEHGERGWCTNNWAFTHRQMVNATDLACQSTIGCWWLPADEEVWLEADDPARGATPRVDRLIAHLDPLKRAVGR